MSGPGARLSASVAVMNSAREAASIMGLRQPGQRLAGDAIDRPLVHRHGAELLVDVDRPLLPVEHGPLEAATAALERDAGKVLQEERATPAAAEFLPHVQIFQVHAGLAEEGREVVEEEREPRDLVADAR